MSDSLHDPSRRSRLIRRGACIGAVLALVGGAGAYATAHHGSDGKSPQSRAINAVVKSGVMTPTPHGFQANKAATRGQLAFALSRSMPRAATVGVGSSVGTGTSGEIAAVRLKFDGAPGKPQAALLTFNGQLDHDNQLSAGCFPSFSVTRNASPTVVASRTQELYGAPTGGLELPVSMSFLLVEKTGTSTNFHLTLNNPCDQTLFIDGGDFTAQNVVLAGNGNAIPAPAKQIQKVRPHDR
ncbi:MAG TPA: S-layer homology domain-containing protein [Nocardioidaceae bacterium]|nr:S-layer homology domain-containing protein [Nocardioidaceae bacterium]